MAQIDQSLGPCYSQEDRLRAQRPKDFNRAEQLSQTITYYLSSDLRREALQEMHGLFVGGNIVRPGGRNDMYQRALERTG